MAKKRQESKEELLLARLEQASGTIQYLNTGYIVVGVIITVIAIIIPVLGYFFVVKPQENLQEYINMHISEYLKKGNDENIERAIKHLQSHDPFVVGKGIDAVAGYPIYNNLTESQILKIIDIAHHRDAKAEAHDIGVALMFTESQIVDRFFADDLAKDDTVAIFGNVAAIHLLSRPNHGIEYLEKIILSNKKRSVSNYLRFVYSSNDMGSADLMTIILDDTKMVDQVGKVATKEELEILNGVINEYLSFYMQPKELKETYFYKKFNK